MPLLIYNLLADGIDVTPEVAELLLRMNYEMPFGALGVRDDGRIAFRHVLFGESLDREGLYKVLRTMADASREIEAEIWNQFSENS